MSSIPHFLSRHPSLSLIFPHKRPLPDAAVLWWPPKQSEAPDAVILLIPGNPGLADFYKPLLQHIYDNSDKNLAILAHSLLGHSPTLHEDSIQPPTRLSQQLQGFIAAYDALRDWNNTKIVVLSHSVGGWIGLQLSKARPDIHAIFLITPTISNILNTPNGRRLAKFFRHPVPLILSKLSPVLNYIPSMIFHIILKGWPDQQMQVLRNFLYSTPSVYASLSLAHDEMNTIKDLDDTALDQREHVFCYLVPHDDWVGMNDTQVLLRMDPDKVSIGNPEIPHAFCIKNEHSIAVAVQCCLWLKQCGV